MEQDQIMTPRAKVAHQLPHRIRIRIQGIKTEKEAYFKRLGAELKADLDDVDIMVRPVTATVILTGPKIDIKRVARCGRRRGHFVLADPHRAACNSVFEVAAGVVNGMNTGLKRITASRLDVSGTVFILLIFHAARELLRGNLRTPSWFTALWVASTLYNRQQHDASFAGQGAWDPAEGGGDGWE